MKVVITCGQQEVATAALTILRNMPQYRGKHVGACSLLVDDRPEADPQRRVSMEVVFFDTAKAAREYVTNPAADDPAPEPAPDPADQPEEKPA